MSRPPASAAARGPLAPGARVYVVRVWVDASPGAFRALARPVEAEQWLGFTSAEDLLAYLVRRDVTAHREPP